MTAAIPEDDLALAPTPDDERVWSEIYGFTPDEIGTMARHVEISEDKVTRLIELMKYMGTLPKYSQDDLDEAVRSAVEDEAYGEDL